MIDIALLREQADVVRASQRARGERSCSPIIDSSSKRLGRLK